MATVTTLIERIATVAGVREAAEAVTRNDGGGDCELRALPNEQIYFWVRTVDNSRIVPQADPKSTRACLKYIGSAGLAVLLLVGVLFPVAYNILAGYQIHALENEQDTLRRQSSELELQEARMLSPARLAELAALQELVDPAPETTVPLEPVGDGALALNR